MTRFTYGNPVIIVQNVSLASNHEGTLWVYIQGAVVPLEVGMGLPDP